MGWPVHRYLCAGQSGGRASRRAWRQRSTSRTSGQLLHRLLAIICLADGLDYPFGVIGAIPAQSPSQGFNAVPGYQSAAGVRQLL